MDSTARLRSWTPSLLLAAVLAILGLVGFIQYQWFSRSAAVEIEGTIRGLEGGLRQSVFREFQRYAPVATELEALRADEGRTDAETKAVLARLWTTYGPEGTSPDLLSMVGLATSPDGAEIRTQAAPAWAVAALPLSETANVDLIVRVGERPGDRAVYLGLNMRTFFENYVFPSLREQYPGAGLSWDDAAPLPPPNGENFNSQTYTFNPFTALFAGASVPRKLNIVIPRLADLPFRGLRSKPSIDAPGPRDPALWRLAVTLPPDAPVLAIERRLAWNWLGGTLLLVFLGVAFAIVLRQSGRLAELRRREREFVASVSHELRTPLTVIRSAADNFSQGIVPPERQARYGQLILDQSLRLGRMVEEMLSFAQAEATGPAAPVQAPVVFEPWLAELRPPLEALAAARQVQLVWDVAGVPLSGLSDPAALRLILENLVVNAVNHAYPGETVGPMPVHVTLRHLVPDRLELTVDDDGRGISPKEAKKVFEPFYRDQVSRDKQEKGSGLGLFLARHQARRLGGDLKLESPWRRLDGVRRTGCRFTALLPFTTAEADHGR